MKEQVLISSNKTTKKSHSLWRDALHRLARNKMAVIGGVFIILLLLVAVFAPFLAPKDYARGNFLRNYAEPDSEYLLGADFMGRDVLSRLIYGTRISLAVGFFGAFNAFVIGIIYGMISGLAGGKVDNMMMRVVDIFYAFPTLLLIILLMVLFKSNVFQVVSHNFIINTILKIDEAVGGLFFIMMGCFLL